MQPQSTHSDQSDNRRRVGLLAGWGSYPVVVAQTLKRQNYYVCCLGVKGHADPVLAELCDDFAWIGLAKLGRAIRYFRRHGVKEATIHRICCLDIDGDQDHEVLLFDDRRHQLSVLAQQNGKLAPQISWPVFEDKKYPYDEGKKTPTLTEPRAVVALDADGDGAQDLAMACHDRVLIYLAHDDEP